MSKRIYIDTSVLVAAFSNEPSQATALAVLQSPQWTQMVVSDWTLAEFACAFGAKVLRGETSANHAHTINQTVKRLIEQGAMQLIPVLREDYLAVQKTVPNMRCLVRGADALHLAAASRNGSTHFASLDKAQRLAAGQWLQGVECVPAFNE